MTYVNDFMLQIMLVFAAYVLVVVAVMVDLKSGIRKAKERGEFRTSYGFRKTVKKLNEYGNVLLILTVMDFMQMLFFKVLNGQLSFIIPVVPVLTFFGAFGVARIEYKSIKEKAFDKTKIEEAEQLAAQIIKEVARNPNFINQLQGLFKRTENEQRITQQQPGQYPNIGNTLQGGSDPLDRPGL